MALEAEKNILDVMRTHGIIGRSPLLLSAINAALQAAPYDVNVLILGENGTGKEVFHKILHQYSPRRHSKCVAVNCGGLPEGTIDSELFGHVKGAFTGATSERKGYFEEADGGTIFLDEIGDLPLPTQVRLLRILETGEYYRMGSSEVRKTDVRVVAATNVDLQKAIRRGTFREDLYYRLSTITIDVPPLRRREEDIYMLFRKFAGDVAAKYRMPVLTLDDEARRLLQAYLWPGNVRQLLHFVEQVSIVETDRLVTAEMVHRYLPDFNSSVSVAGDSHGDGGEGFLPGEKAQLYQMILAMKRQMDEMARMMGMPSASRAQPGATTPLLAESSSAPATADGAVISIIPPASVHVGDEGQHGAGLSGWERKMTSHVASAGSAADGLLPGDQPITLDELERKAIARALHRNGGNKRKAAEELGIAERTIHRKIEQYGL